MRTQNFFFSLLALAGIISCLPLCANAQGNIEPSNIELAWETRLNEKGDSYLYFDEAVYNVSKQRELPHYLIQVPLSQNNRKFILSDIETERVDEKPIIDKLADHLNSDFTITQEILTNNGERLLQLKLLPLRKIDSDIERLVSFRLLPEGERMKIPEPLNVTTATKENATVSVLASGNWYKVSVTSSGLFQIDVSAMQDLGIDPTVIDPRKLAIYGQSGGMLTEGNSEFRYDDLVQIPIIVEGEGDGTFAGSDRIIFYAEGPHAWKYQSGIGRYYHEKNLYSERNYYYLNIGNTNPKRVLSQPAMSGTADYVSQGFDVLASHELDEVNHIRSGREWYGELFDIELSRTISFEPANVDVSIPVWFRADVMSRSFTAVNNQFTLTAPGGVKKDLRMQATSSYYLDAFGHSARDSGSFITSSNKIDFNFSYSKPQAFSRGWLNFIEINARGKWQMTGSRMRLVDKYSIGAQLVEYRLSNANDVRIWDVTDPENIYEFQDNVLSGTFTFQAPGDTLRSFMAFRSGVFPKPNTHGKVLNQNLHGSPQVDLICVAHPDYMNAARRLCEFHLKEDGYSYALASPGQIYNEFSSGKQDISAIRDYVRMFYKRATTDAEKPKFLLLFGDASFDYKNRIPGNTNFVPTYMSRGSLRPLSTYPSDAFFALMDENEGAFLDFTSETMDLAVGRLPVGSPEAADAMVDKIISYAGATAFGDWKNVISIIADDQDGNLHLNQGQVLSGAIKTNYPQAVIDKIYLDAYLQTSKAGATLYPDVNKAITNRFNQGALLIGYIGHGGTAGFAEERVLTPTDVERWTNKPRLPVMVTATCELSRYDDATEQSIGEDILLKEDGGAVALLTTVRTTFAHENFALTLNLYKNHLFVKENGVYPTLGEACYKAMNPTLASINTRCFTLLGDPALRLAYPEKEVRLEEFQARPLAASQDTLRALSKVKFAGKLYDDNGSHLNSYNGELTAVVYDKFSQVKTLVNDATGIDVSRPATFQKRENIIYKGKASIVNGAFSFEFIVPKDIAYNFDFGRISLYAEDGNTDGAGFYDSLVVGGTALNPIEDDLGPDIKLYLNSTSFINGGTTDESPRLLAFVVDSSGINTVGGGIGHDITAELTGEGSPIILNEYYLAEKDNFMKGEVRYPFDQLSEGEHTLTFKVWDVLNNSSEAELDFVVAVEEDLAIRNLINYPNPFTTNTTFHFDHNRPGESMRAQIQVFSMDGNLVKTIDGDIMADGYHEDSLVWDGLDDYGGRLARGVYLYKLKLRTDDGQLEQAIEKLVILR